MATIIAPPIKTLQLRGGIARRAKMGQQRCQQLDVRSTAFNRIRARGKYVFAGLEHLGGSACRP